MFAELGYASPGVTFESPSGLTGDLVGEGWSITIAEVPTWRVSRKAGGGIFDD